MSINWYPGHMTSAKRKMQEELKLVDCIIEILDARAPLSSKNPDIDTLAANKKKVILLNKADLADPARNREWTKHYTELGYEVVLLDSRNRKDALKVSQAVRKACAEKIERDRKRGIMNRSIKAMVCGIPNVGKSTFINSFVGKTTAKTGNKPGVTKGNQWIRLSNDINLLDTPGILWPKIEDPEAGYRLSFIGSINDNILDLRDISFQLIAFMVKNYQSALCERYKLEGDFSLEGTDQENLERLNDILCQIAEHKNCLKKGGEPDIDKACVLLIDDLRSGKLGRITFDIL